PDRLLHAGVQLLQGLAGERGDELVLAGEVAVDQPGGEPRGGEEVLHRGRVEALVGEAAPGRLQDLAAAGVAVLVAHPGHGRILNGPSLLDNSGGPGHPVGARTTEGPRWGPSQRGPVRPPGLRPPGAAGRGWRRPGGCGWGRW